MKIHIDIVNFITTKDSNAFEFHVFTPKQSKSIVFTNGSSRFTVFQSKKRPGMEIVNSFHSRAGNLLFIFYLTSTAFDLAWYKFPKLTNFTSPLFSALIQFFVSKTTGLAISVEYFPKSMFLNSL